MRDVENYRLIDGAKIDNLPADTTTDLAGKENKNEKGIAN
tara:strand:- start:203 stop:322 length:120 start_codon:yes stop_codon:yes gene_type:complete